MRVLLQKYSLHDNDERGVEKVVLKSGAETLSAPYREVVTELRQDPGYQSQ